MKSSQATLVVLELSSFQLEQMTLSPQVAAILNITPNHLDRHGTMQAYTAAKARFLAFQSASDMAVLGRDDPNAWSLASQVNGRLVSFGLRQPEKGQTGTFCRSGKLYLQDGATVVELMRPERRCSLRGQHNLLNVLAACAIAWAAGFPGRSHAQGRVRAYRCAAPPGIGAPVAKAPVGTTTRLPPPPSAPWPTSTLSSEPLVLMLGGRDKNLPWEELADLIHQRVDHVVVFGEASEKILKALGPLRSRQTALHDLTAA